MSQTLATFDAALKEIYEPRLRKQLNDEHPVLSRIQKTAKGTSSDAGGKYVVIGLHVSRNQGIGSRGEGELLPNAGRQGVAVSRVGLTYHYGAVQLSGQAIELAESDKQAFASALDLEMTGLPTDLKLDLNRQLYGDGTGKIAAVTAISGVTITLDNTQFIQVGMLIDFVNTATNAVTGLAEIAGYDDAAGTITLKAAPTGGTPAVGHIITRRGNYKREWNGFGAIIGTADFQGVNVADVPLWKSHIETNGGTAKAVSEGMFDKFVDGMRKSGAGLPTLCVTTPGVRRAYAHLLQQLRHINDTTSLTGGYSQIKYVTDTGDIPILSDYYAPKGTATFINEAHIKMYRPRDWSWLDRNGSKWRQVTGAGGVYDAWEARLAQYSQLGTDRRNAHGRISNIDED